MSELKAPSELYYTEEHEWVELIKEERGYAYIGLTDYAQNQLGDIVYVEIDHEIGAELEMGENLGTVEAVKTVADIFMPISGKIAEINEDLEDSPHNVNDEPYEEGWIIKVKLSTTTDLDSLMNSEEYFEYTIGF